MQTNANTDTATTSSSLDQLEARLAQLEFRLGTSPSPTTTTTATATPASLEDVSSRLDKLTRLPPSNNSTTSNTSNATAKQKAETKRQALHQDFQTVDRLLGELAFSPIAGPTAASSVASASSSSGGGGFTIAEAPMHFRRMEILASSETLKRDMDLLARIRDLTLIGTKASATTTTTASLGSDNHNDKSSHCVNCPIVASDRYNLPSDEEQVERLERLCHRVANLHGRSGKVALRVDEMLNCYSEVMAALSEKIVLAQEQIHG